MGIIGNLDRVDDDQLPVSEFVRVALAAEGPGIHKFESKQMINL